MAKKKIYTKEELLAKNAENDEQVREMVFLWRSQQIACSHSRHESSFEMRFNLDTDNLANVLDRSTSVGKVTYNQLTLLENNEKP